LAHKCPARRQGAPKKLWGGGNQRGGVDWGKVGKDTDCQKSGSSQAFSSWESGGKEPARYLGVGESWKRSLRGAGGVKRESLGQRKEACAPGKSRSIKNWLGEASRGRVGADESMWSNRGKKKKKRCGGGMRMNPGAKVFIIWKISQG